MRRDTRPPTDPAPTPDQIAVRLLDRARTGAGVLARIAEDSLGFLISVGGAVYVHVATDDDGTWAFAPLDGCAQASQDQSRAVLAPSTRWRMFFTASNDADGYIGIRELEMASAPGGADLCTGGTATASSEYLPFNPATYAFDNDADGWSYWSSNGAPPQWLEYAFATPVTIVEYRLRAEGDEPGSEAFYAPKSWTFEFWNGSSWVVVDAQTDQTAWGSGETRLFAVSAAPTPGFTAIRLLSPDRRLNRLVQIPDAQFKAIVNYTDVLFTHVSTDAAGVWEYAPINAKGLG